MFLVGFAFELTTYNPQYAGETAPGPLVKKNKYLRCFYFWRLTSSFWTIILNLSSSHFYLETITEMGISTVVVSNELYSLTLLQLSTF